MSRFYTPSAAAEGPDWVDVGVVMRELQNLSNGTVKLTFETPMDKYAGPLYITAVHEYPVVVKGARPARDQVTGEFPNKTHRSMSALVFKLVMELDTLYSPYGEQVAMDI